MPELIDRETLLHELCGMCCAGEKYKCRYPWGECDEAKLIKKQPTIEAEPVRHDTPRQYEAYNTLSDIERILNFFDGNMTADVDLSSTLHRYFDQNITKNIKCKFFDCTFYKKGTVHIVFTCPKLIDRFNIYAAQKRGWLPPSYGKK